MKKRIYKSTVRPILTYEAETRPDTAITRRKMQVSEMNILRRVLGRT